MTTKASNVYYQIRQLRKSHISVDTRMTAMLKENLTHLAGKGTASTTKLLSNTPPNATQIYVRLMSKIIVVIGNLAC